ncbi:hypothetical protein QA597_01550 [Marinilabiliaceae bacterium ANBcel2]|nr:hypothetical protein [Marinilabiliaceae bacterium ANBcel2]
MSTDKVNTKNLMSQPLKSCFTVLILFMTFTFSLLAKENEKELPEERRVNRQIESTIMLYESYAENVREAETLLSRGRDIIDSTSIKIQRATDEMREESRIYNSKRRELERDMNATSGSQAGKLRRDIQDLDNEYREVLQYYDDYMEELLEKSDKARTIYQQGERKKKRYSEEMKKIEQRLADLRLQKMNIYNDSDIASN